MLKSTSHEPDFLTSLNLLRETGLAQIEDPALREDLLFCWREALQRLEERAISLEQGQADFYDLAEIRRILHTIKGDAGLFALNQVATVIHQTEDFFEEQIDHGKCPTNQLLAVSDWLGNLLDDAGGVIDKTRPACDRQTKEALKILVADDDASCRLMLQAILQQYGEVLQVEDGREAVSAARQARNRQHPFDLICLDIMMPEMDGQQALRQIRQGEEEYGIISSHGSVIIMVTSLDDLRNVSRAYQSLCDGYLVKPIDRQRLLRELSKFGLRQ